MKVIMAACTSFSRMAGLRCLIAFQARLVTVNTSRTIGLSEFNENNRIITHKNSKEILKKFPIADKNLPALI